MKKSLSGIFVVSYLLVMLVLLTVIVGCFSIIRHQAGMQADISAKAVLNDTAAGLTDMVQAAIDGGNIIADHKDVYSFASGTPTERLKLRDNVRSLLSTYVRFESGAVNAYLFTADGAHISAAPQSMEHDGAAAYMISRRVWWTSSWISLSVRRISAGIMSMAGECTMWYVHRFIRMWQRP